MNTISRRLAGLLVRSFTVNVLLSISFLSSFSWSSAAAAEQRVEGESMGVGTRIEDPTAFGGAAITASRAWEPVVKMAAPEPGAGDKVSLWVRQRGGPLQLKAITSDGQKEIAWN